MCKFIIGVFKPDSNLRLVNDCATQFDFAFVPIQNMLIRDMWKGCTAAKLTRDCCDCRSWLGEGRSHRLKSDHQSALSEEIAKRKKRGWNDHKIARWKNEKEKHDVALGEKQANNSIEELTRWKNFISAVTDEGGLPCVGLIIHDFIGSIDEESFSLLRVETLSRSAISTETLAKLQFDVLYVIGNDVSKFVDKQLPC